MHQFFVAATCLLAIVIVVLPVISPSQTRDMSDRTRVRIVVVNPFGEPLHNLMLTSFRDDKGKDFAGSFRELVGDNIPVGYQYSMVIKFSGGAAITQKVVVDHPDYLMVLGISALHIDYPRGRAPKLRGTLEAVPNGFVRPIWVKICYLFLNGCEVAEVDADNHFEFMNMDSAAYSLALLDAAGHGIVERIEVRDPGSQVTIDLLRGPGDRVKISSRFTSPDLVPKN